MECDWKLLNCKLKVSYFASLHSASKKKMNMKFISNYVIPNRFPENMRPGKTISWWWGQFVSCCLFSLTEKAPQRLKHGRQTEPWPTNDRRPRLTSHVVQSRLAQWLSERGDRSDEKRVPWRDDRPACFCDVWWRHIRWFDDVIRTVVWWRQAWHVVTSQDTRELRLPTKLPSRAASICR